MEYPSSKDEAFLARVSKLFSAQREVLVLFRYPRAAGSKDFIFFSDMHSFQSQLDSKPPATNVIVYSEPQLPLRGRVDSEFISRALEFIEDGSEYLVLCLEKTVHDYRPHHYWESFDDSAGETHEELSESLSEYLGKVVAVGLWPPWPDESDSSFEAYVPDASGLIQPGPY